MSKDRLKRARNKLHDEKNYQQYRHTADSLGFPVLTRRQLRAQDVKDRARELQEKTTLIQRSKQEYNLLARVLTEPTNAGDSPSPREQMQRIADGLTAIQAALPLHRGNGEMLRMLSSQNLLLTGLGRHLQAAHPKTDTITLPGNDTILAASPEATRMVRKETYEATIAITNDPTLSLEERIMQLQTIGQQKFQDVFHQRAVAEREGLTEEQIADLELEKNRRMEQNDFVFTIADLVHASAIDLTDPEQIRTFRPYHR